MRTKTETYNTNVNMFCNTYKWFHGTIKYHLLLFS